MLAYGESLKLISRVPHKLGDVVKMSDESAQLIAYYRNNVLHLFALPSLVACAFIGNSMLRTEDIQRLAWRVYPYVASELFLRWREDELSRVVDGVLAALAENGVLQPDESRSAWMRPPPDSPRCAWDRACCARKRRRWPRSRFCRRATAICRANDGLNRAR